MSVAGRVEEERRVGETYQRSQRPCERHRSRYPVYPRGLHRPDPALYTAHIEARQHLPHSLILIRFLARYWRFRAEEKGAYLGRKNKGRELLGIDPMQLANDTQRRQHPPAITHIFELLRSPVQASIGHLSLGQPGTDSVRIDAVQCFQYRERSDADPGYRHHHVGQSCRKMNVSTGGQAVCKEGL